MLNLKILGFLCFSYILKLRETLDKKAESGTLVGYSLTSKAYDIYHPQSKKIIVSRDVQFFESEKWIWEDDKKLEASMKKL